MPVIKDLNLIAKDIVALDCLSQDYVQLIENMKDANIVLLGSASHGTNECFKIRAEITQYLIEEKGFHAVAIEGDWTAAYNVNKYIKNKYKSPNKFKALASFDHFPSWMWCNDVMLDFITWLRNFNDRSFINKLKVGLYGLDLYSLHSSMDMVLEYLEKIDPEAAARARKRYHSFSNHSTDPIFYSLSVDKGIIPGCTEELFGQCLELLKNIDHYTYEPNIDHEETLFVNQNAKIVANGEAYYRLLLKEPEVLWNFREEHMLETLETIRLHYQHILGITPKLVIWAHNMHVANVPPAYSLKKGRTTFGELIKNKYHKNCYSLGFTVYSGEVTTTSQWGGHTETRSIRPTPYLSYEYLFHQFNIPKFLIFLRKETTLPKHSSQRAMRIIYSEDMLINYHFDSYLSKEYNAVIHIDVSTPLIPLHEVYGWREGELPRTYPSGF